jgi:hypothetical protein
MDGGNARTAPAGVERWFHAPRNPVVPAPADREIPTGGAGGGGDGVDVYKGSALPPAEESRIARGGLFFYRHGMLFLPFAPAEAKSWLDEMSVPLDMMLGGAADIFLPFGNIFLDAARDVVIGEVLFGRSEREKAERELQARWDHPGLFAVPLVNITEASCCSVRTRGLFGKRVGYMTLTTRDAEGQEETRIFGFPSSCETMPGALFTARMAREIEFYKARAARKLTGYDERMRAALARLGLNVTAAEVDFAAIGEAIERAQQTGGSGQLDQVTVGQLMDTLQDVGTAAWEETKARLDDRMPQEMSRLLLADMEPMLPDYRRVPAMVHQIEVMERVAGGETSRDWTPAWRPETYDANFASGEYPVRSGG